MVKIKIRLTTLTGGQPYQSFSKLCKIFRAAKVRKIILNTWLYNKIYEFFNLNQFIWPDNSLP